MASWATATFSSNQLVPLSAVVTAAAAPCSSCRANFLKVCSPRRGRLYLFVAENHSRLRTFEVASNRVSTLQTQPGTWEDPDDGSGSDCEEEDEEVEENNLDYESDWEEERNASATVSVDKPTTNEYEEDLVKGSYFARTLYSPLYLYLFSDFACTVFNEKLEISRTL